MSRSFSTSAKALLKFIWAGTSKKPKWEDATRAFIENNSKLPKIETVEVHGDPHASKDPKEHISVVMWVANKTNAITSAHIYAEGTGRCSKKIYRDSD